MYYYINSDDNVIKNMSTTGVVIGFIIAEITTKDTIEYTVRTTVYHKWTNHMVTRDTIRIEADCSL